MIYLIGDPHGNYEQIIRILRRDKPAAAIFLGDMDLEQPLDRELASVLGDTEVWWIHGNHDADRQTWYDHLFRSGLGDRSLHARVVDVAGTRVAGLGGVFRGKVWMPDRQARDRELLMGTARYRNPDEFMADRPSNVRRSGMPLKHHATIWPDHYDGLAEHRADVLVCHEAPSCHTSGFGALDSLAETLGVTKVFHGHHHKTYDGRIGDCGIKVHGVGLGGIRDLDGNVIVPGEYD
jgi:predicted phosphodiesterase